MKLAILALIVAACGSTTPAQSASTDGAATASDATPVATWSGGTITSSDLDDSIGVTLIKLEADFLKGQHEARQQGLDALLG